VYIEDGNPDHVDGLINIFKRTMEYKTICTILKGKNTPYRFKKIPSMYTYFYLLRELLTEEEIDKYSRMRIEEEARTDSYIG
jgi:hypothetical protein